MISFLSTILAQLAMQLSTIPSMLHDFHKTHQHGRPTEAGLLTAIKHLLLLIGPTYIICDALDECPEKGGERKDLCQALAEIHQWSLPNVHFLVTSRKEYDLSIALDAMATSDPINITEEVEVDIRQYVSTQLSTDSQLSEYSHECKHEIEEVLVNKAKGM